MQVATDNKPDPEADPQKLVLVPADHPISIQVLIPREVARESGMRSPTNPI